MPKSRTAWEIIALFPPPLVRLMARRRVGSRTILALSDEEVALRSGMPMARVQEIYFLIDWDHVTIDEMRKFCKGCAFDLFNSDDRNRAFSYQRSCGGTPSFFYLKRSPHWESVFKPLILHLKKNGL